MSLHRTTFVLLLSTLSLVLVGSTARAGGPEWPDEFNIADVELTVTRVITTCFAGGIRTVRLTGRGSGEDCLAPPLYTIDAWETECRALTVTPEVLLEHLGRLATVDFLSLRGKQAGPASVTFGMDEHGRVSHPLEWTTSSGVDWTISLRIASFFHEVTYASGMPCELKEWAEQLLAEGPLAKNGETTPSTPRGASGEPPAERHAPPLAEGQSR